MKSIERLWTGSRDCSEYSYFEDGYTKALDQVETEIEKLLNISEYTNDAKLVKTLIKQTQDVIVKANQ